MNHDSPAQQPEGALLQEAQKASGLSIRSASAQAGVSESRWRQIVKGSMHVQGVLVPVVAPADTLARMAHVVGVTGDQLRETGRADAAGELENIEPADPGSHVQAPRAPAPAPVNDEIDMIYASKSMTAKQKLQAIRMVLHLRAEVDAATATTTAHDAQVVTDPAES